MDGETQWRAGLVVAVRNRKLKANYGVLHYYSM
jgi:hypothetical protein